MPALLEWVWHNDPEGLPDSDHARCIAATGERSLVYGAHLFKLTTVPSISPTARSSTATSSWLCAPPGLVPLSEVLLVDDSGSDICDGFLRVIQL